MQNLRAFFFSGSGSAGGGGLGLLLLLLLSLLLLLLLLPRAVAAAAASAALLLLLSLSLFLLLDQFLAILDGLFREPSRLVGKPSAPVSPPFGLACALLCRQSTDPGPEAEAALAGLG